MPGDGHSATSTTVDRYLETIYCIAGEGETVRPSRLAAWLGVAAPTVSDAVQRLARDGWVDVASDRSVTLTADGQRAAAALIRRHRVLERWLVDVLHFDWATADVEADSMSSAFSDLVIDRLDGSMGLPSTCPHGNPIPGRTPSYGRLESLAELAAGAHARVRRISEVAEHEARALLTLLSDHGIKEGTEIAVLDPEEDPLVVQSDSRTFTLPRSAAQWIWVERP